MDNPDEKKVDVTTLSSLVHVGREKTSGSIYEVVDNPS